MLVTCFSTARGGHDELLGDRLVRPALRHQLEHLPLARGERVERIVAASAPHESRDHGGVERRAALGDATNRVGELGDVCDPVLEQVTDAFRAPLEQLERVAGLDVRREHEHAHVRVALADLLRGAEPFVGVRRRHADVDDRDVRLVAPDLQQQVVCGARLPGDLEARVLEELRDPLAEKHRVVCDHHAHRESFRRTVVRRRPKLARQVVVEYLEDSLAFREAGEALLAEVRELEVPGRHPRARGRRNEDLAAGRRGAHARRTVNLEPDVAPVSQLGLTGVDAHPNPGQRVLRPGVAGQGPLSGDRRSHGSRGLGERGEVLVRAAVDLMAVRGADGLADQAAVLLEQAEIGLPEPPRERRRALDVGDQEGDDPAGQLHRTI